MINISYKNHIKIIQQSYNSYMVVISIELFPKDMYENHLGYIGS